MSMKPWPRWHWWFASLVTAIVHCLISFELWGLAFGWGESSPRPTGPIVWLVQIFVAGLLFPLVYVIGFLGRWLAIPDSLYWGAFVINSIFWGVALMLLV